MSLVSNLATPEITQSRNRKIYTRQYHDQLQDDNISRKKKKTNTVLVFTPSISVELHIHEWCQARGIRGGSVKQTRVARFAVSETQATGQAEVVELPEDLVRRTYICCTSSSIIFGAKRRTSPLL